ncbi:Methyltransferase domain-containing protein [Dehalogenimonas formicexedens]|uniref:Methyltransferase domain-containing protein n=1 Tax=Dehalogenimonas formicexedens TaxID=1839801 RepID=A0A1P8F540_9CHLR|nr:class I SAM-dependent methyltransferase [Dehalogenimonas formicexedens]APV43599.1 Methyltransferase domain-containing protein [Dehalogenimonas formicexedens]
MNNSERFTNRVAYYVKYRPSYPEAYLGYLATEVGFKENSVVADIGAGTGILSKLLARRVKRVFAVEPNHQMRLAAQEYCKDAGNVAVVNGCAEATTLPDASVDFITAAQAFHWFKIDEARKEFSRILRPGGKTALVWNVRDISTPFGKEYEKIVKQFCLDYIGSGGGSSETLAYRMFFKGGKYDYRAFPNDRRIDLETLLGYSLSTSYAPNRGDENYNDFIQSLKDIFARYAIDGTVLLSTITQSYVGEIEPSPSSGQAPDRLFPSF